MLGSRSGDDFGGVVAWASTTGFSAVVADGDARTLSADLVASAASWRARARLGSMACSLGFDRLASAGDCTLTLPTMRESTSALPIAINPMNAAESNRKLLSNMTPPTTGLTRSRLKPYRAGEPRITLRERPNT